jgi:hypothetical protein
MPNLNNTPNNNQNDVISTNAVQWTYIGYFCADNNLDEYGVDDVNEMEKGMDNGADAKVIVLIDRYYSGAKTYDIQYDTSSSITSPVVYPTGVASEPNMGDGSTLEAFLTWVFNNPTYQADKYILDLWDHGAGWPGICYDDHSGQDGLTLQELRNAVDGALTTAGEDKIDIISMDACLMGMLEVSYYLEGLCDVFIASEEVIYAPGYPYEDVISELCAHVGENAYEIAERTVDAYENLYSSYDGCTLSAVNISTDSYNDLMGTFEDFASSMYDYLLGQTDEIESARSQVQEFYYPYYVDLYDLCDYLSTAGLTYISANASLMKTAISNAVIDYCATGTSKARGISIYFPETDAEYSSSYLSQLIALNTEWDEFLGYYYTAPSISVSITSYDTNSTVTNGSTIELDVSLKNTGTVLATEVKASLHSNNINVTVSPTDKFHDYGSMSVGTEKTGTYIFNVSSDIPNGSIIEIFYNLSTKYSGIPTVLKRNISLFFVIGSDAVMGGDSFAYAEPIPFGYFLGLLPGPAADLSGWYKFSVTSDMTSVLLNLTCPSSTADFDLYVYSPSEVLTTIAASSTFPDVTSFRVQEAGEYRVRVHPYAGEGIFFLNIIQDQKFEDGNSIGTAFEIILPDNSTIPGNLPNSENSNGYDYYRIVLSAGESISLTLNGDSGSDFDLYIVDYGFNVLDYSYNSYYPERLRFTAETSSVYYIIIIPYSGSGSYTLEVTSGGGGFGNWTTIILIVVIVAVVFVGLIIYWKYFT